MEREPQTLEAAIAVELRRRRREAGATQDELAAAMRGLGFDGWTRSVVAAMESGSRRLSLPETIALTAALRTSLAALLKDQEDPLQLSAYLDVRGPDVVPVLAGDQQVHQTDAATLSVLDRLEAYTKGNAILQAADQDAERRAARILGTDSLTVATAAFGQWGHSLTDERNRRVFESFGGELGPDGFARKPAKTVSPERLQAARGHVTRRLLRELRPAVRAIEAKREEG